MKNNCSRLDPEIREISYSDGSQIQIQISKQGGMRTKMLGYFFGARTTVPCYRQW
jgi:hypothetical protein